MIITVATARERIITVVSAHPLERATSTRIIPTRINADRNIRVNFPILSIIPYQRQSSDILNDNLYLSFFI